MLIVERHREDEDVGDDEEVIKDEESEDEMTVGQR